MEETTPVNEILVARGVYANKRLLAHSTRSSPLEMLHRTGANGTDRALSAAATFQELQAEYDKFRESSNELEKELEEELSRMQNRARVSEDEIWRAKEENKELKTRFTKQVRPQ